MRAGQLGYLVMLKLRPPPSCNPQNVQAYSFVPFCGAASFSVTVQNSATPLGMPWCALVFAVPLPLWLATLATQTMQISPTCRKNNRCLLCNWLEGTDVWEKDVWEIQAKSGSSGSGRLFLGFLGKVAVRKMSGKTPGSPRHPSSRHVRPSAWILVRKHLVLKLKAGPSQFCQWWVSLFCRVSFRVPVWGPAKPIAAEHVGRV